MPEPTTPTWGYLYVVAAHDNDTPGRVKLGFSTDPARRIRALQTASPVPLQLLVAVPGTMGDEAYLHERFAAARMSGEWFERARSIDLDTWIDELERVAWLPSWQRCAPLPMANDTTADELGELFGENRHAVRALKRYSNLSAVDLYTQLAYGNDLIKPDGGEMAYGLAAAITAKVGSPKYVFACIEHGVNRGALS